MSDNRLDPEMQALLSGHAAGTLTPEEKKRLHEAALHNQALFDAMAEEEPLRAALMSSIAKQGLLRALQKIEDKRGPIDIPKPNYWLWAAIGACLVVGAATVAYWPTPKDAIQEVALVNKPQPVSAPTPEPEPAPQARSAAPPPTPAQAPLAIAESTLEKREAKAAKQPQAQAVADSSRQEVAAPAGNSFRERNAPSVAKRASASAPVAVEIFNDNLTFRAAIDSQIYAFLIDGDSIKPLTTANDNRRSIPLGAHTAKAEVWLLITATEDPVLARALTGVLPLPTRNWIKLKTNP